jgi:hypothetical protein
VTTRTIPRQDIQELKGQTGVKMNAKLFAAVFGASVLMAAPVQAKFIGIAIYDPKVMLPICKNEIAQGRAGVCTGYVIAISEGNESIFGLGTARQPPYSVPHNSPSRA